MTQHRSIAMVTIAALVHLTAFSEPALAGSPAEKMDQVRAAVMKMEVGQDTRVSVKLRDNKIVVGYLAAVRDHSFLVMDPETHVTIQVPYRNVKHLNAMSPIAKIAIGVGVAVVGLMLICIAAQSQNGPGC